MTLHYLTDIPRLENLRSVPMIRAVLKRMVVGYYDLQSVDAPFDPHNPDYRVLTEAELADPDRYGSNEVSFDLARRKLLASIDFLPLDGASGFNVCLKYTSVTVVKVMMESIFSPFDLIQETFRRREFPAGFIEVHAWARCVCEAVLQMYSPTGSTDDVGLYNFVEMDEDDQRVQLQDLDHLMTSLIGVFDDTFVIFGIQELSIFPVGCQVDYASYAIGQVNIDKKKTRPHLRVVKT